MPHRVESIGLPLLRHSDDSIDTESAACRLNPTMLTFSSSLFWDCDSDSIDLEAHSAFVIGRVLMRGRLADWQKLKRHYGIERLRREIVRLRQLDPRTLAFCAAYFDLPRESFRCFSKTPSSSPTPAVS